MGQDSTDEIGELIGELERRFQIQEDQYEDRRDGNDDFHHRVFVRSRVGEQQDVRNGEQHDGTLSESAVGYRA